MPSTCWSWTATDWRPRTLEERKDRLAQLLADAPAGIQYSEHLEGDGAAIFAHACKLGAEGIVSKHREHPYRSGPIKAWLKTKNPASTWYAAVPGGAMSDHLETALYLRGWRSARLARRSGGAPLPRSVICARRQSAPSAGS